MDAENQQINGGKKFSVSNLKEHVKEKTKNPTANGTLIIFLILNIIMLIVGIVKINDCPIKSSIPIYLVVAGAIGILSKTLPFINAKFELRIITFCLCLMYFFEIIWMVVGSFWVYSIYKPNFNESINPYCSKTAYYLAFWLLTVNWILLAVATVLICCAVCVTALM